jgi:hypothetical protein
VQGNSRTWYYQVLRWVDASNHQIVFRMSSTNSSSVVYFQNGQAGFGGFAGSMTTFYGYLLTGSPKPGPSATVEFIWDMGNPRYHEDFTLTVKTGDEGAFRGNYSTWSYRVIRWVSATNHQIMFHMGNQNSNDVVYFENGQAGFAGFASWMTTFYGYLQVVP